MFVVETITEHSDNGFRVLSTFSFTGKERLEQYKKSLKESGFKYNRQERRYEKYLKGLKVTLAHSFDTLKK